MMLPTSYPPRLRKVPPETEKFISLAGSRTPMFQCWGPPREHENWRWSWLHQLVPTQHWYGGTGGRRTIWVRLYIRGYLSKSGRVDYQFFISKIERKSLWYTTSQDDFHQILFMLKQIKKFTWKMCFPLGFHERRLERRCFSLGIHERRKLTKEKY